MKALLSAAVELCLLRLGPQHMPASQALLGLLLLVNLAVGTLIVMMRNIEFSMALLESMFELGMMLAVLHVALTLVGKLSRYSQTLIALQLSGALLNSLALPLVSWNQNTAAVESALLLWLLIFWIILVVGHIIRHAFNVNLNIGIAASLCYTLTTWGLAAVLFPVPV